MLTNKPNKKRVDDKTRTTTGRTITLYRRKNNNSNNKLIMVKSDYDDKSKSQWRREYASRSKHCDSQKKSESDISQRKGGREKERRDNEVAERKK